MRSNILLSVILVASLLVSISARGDNRGGNLRRSNGNYGYGNHGGYGSYSGYGSYGGYGHGGYGSYGGYGHGGFGDYYSGGFSHRDCFNYRSSYTDTSFKQGQYHIRESF